MKWIEVERNLIEDGKRTDVKITSLIPLSEIKEIKIFCKFEHEEDDSIWNRYKVELHTKGNAVFTTTCRQGIIKSLVSEYGNNYEPRYVIGKFLETDEENKILDFFFTGDGNQGYE